MQISFFQQFAGIIQASGPRRAVVGGLLLGAWLAPDPAWAQALADARRLYNLGRYEAAVEAAAIAAREPSARHAALVVLGRAGLERFRQTADPADLARAREALRDVDASRLDPRDKVELLFGLGEALYLDDVFLPAAHILESAIDNAAMLGPSARDQLLDWWATALDHHAQTRPPAERLVVYGRLADRMAAELERDPATASAAYWMAVAARSLGDADRAWELARAGWVRAQLTRDRGAALRPDLDRLVRDAIIPERARRQQTIGADVEQATAGMTAEWDAFTTKWSR